MKIKKNLAILVSACILLASIIPFSVSANSTYNTTVSANAGTIVTANSSWGGADLFRSSTCYRVTPSAPATIVYSVTNATRFKVAAAQHSGLSQLLSFEVSTDGANYTAVNMTVNTVGSYTNGSNWPINEQEYISPDFATPVTSIRITKAECYNEWYFAMADVKYEKAPITYNTTVSANGGTVVTANSSWGAADLFRSATCYRITPSAPATIVYSVLNATRFNVSAAQHSGLSQLLSFEVSTDGTNYTAVNMTVNTIGSYTNGSNWPINEQEYVSPDFATPITSIRITKAECYNEWYFAMANVKYERAPISYNTTISANGGTVVTANSSWGESILYRNSTCYRVTPSTPATIVYNVLNATRFKISAAQHSGLSQLLSFEVSTDGTNYTAVNMIVSTVASYTNADNWPINEQEYISSDFTTPITSIRITKAECYNEWYFAMADLKCEMNVNITSSIYSISDSTRIIKGISEKTMASNVLSSLTSSANVTIVDTNNNPVSANAFVGTGMKLQRTFNSQVVYEITVVVTADVNGDGEVSVNDLIAMKKHLLKLQQLTGVKLTAGDIFGKGSITVSDLLAVKKFLLGSYILP